MTSGEMARSYLRQARLILEEAERHHHASAWHLVVRRCQEAVELALKAALRAAGIEVPHVHDVGVFFLERKPSGTPASSSSSARAAFRPLPLINLSPE